MNPLTPNSIPVGASSAVPIDADASGSQSVSASVQQTTNINSNTPKRLIRHITVLDSNKLKQAGLDRKLAVAIGKQKFSKRNVSDAENKSVGTVAPISTASTIATTLPTSTPLIMCTPSSISTPSTISTLSTMSTLSSMCTPSTSTKSTPSSPLTSSKSTTSKPIPSTKPTSTPYVKSIMPRTSATILNETTIRETTMTDPMKSGAQMTHVKNLLNKKLLTKSQRAADQLSASGSTAEAPMSTVKLPTRPKGVEIPKASIVGPKDKANYKPKQHLKSKSRLSKKQLKKQTEVAALDSDNANIQQPRILNFEKKYRTTTQPTLDVSQEHTDSARNSIDVIRSSTTSGKTGNSSRNSMSMFKEHQLKIIEAPKVKGQAPLYSNLMDKSKNGQLSALQLTAEPIATSKETPFHENNLIVLENKVLSHDEKIDLAALRLPKQKFDDDVSSSTRLEKIVQEESKPSLCIAKTLNTDVKAANLQLNIDKLKLPPEKMTALAKKIQDQVAIKQNSGIKKQIYTLKQLPQAEKNFSEKSIIVKKPCVLNQQTLAQNSNAQNVTETATDFIETLIPPKPVASLKLSVIKPIKIFDGTNYGKGILRDTTLDYSPSTSAAASTTALKTLFDKTNKSNVSNMRTSNSNKIVMLAINKSASGDIRATITKAPTVVDAKKNHKLIDVDVGNVQNSSAVSKEPVVTDLPTSKVDEIPTCKVDKIPTSKVDKIPTFKVDKIPTTSKVNGRTAENLSSTISAVDFIASFAAKISKTAIPTMELSAEELNLNASFAELPSLDPCYSSLKMSLLSKKTEPKTSREIKEAVTVASKNYQDNSSTTNPNLEIGQILVMKNEDVHKTSISGLDHNVLSIRPFKNVDIDNVSTSTVNSLNENIVQETEAAPSKKEEKNSVKAKKYSDDIGEVESLVIMTENSTSTTKEPKALKEIHSENIDNVTESLISNNVSLPNKNVIESTEDTEQKNSNDNEQCQHSTQMKPSVNEMNNVNQFSYESSIDTSQDLTEKLIDNNSKVHSFEERAFSDEQIHEIKLNDLNQFISNQDEPIDRNKKASENALSDNLKTDQRKAKSKLETELTHCRDVRSPKKSSKRKSKHNSEALEDAIPIEKVIKIPQIHSEKQTFVKKQLAFRRISVDARELPEPNGIKNFIQHIENTNISANIQQQEDTKITANIQEQEDTIIASKIRQQRIEELYGIPMANEKIEDKVENKYSKIRPVLSLKRFAKIKELDSIEQSEKVECYQFKKPTTEITCAKNINTEHVTNKKVIEKHHSMSEEKDFCKFTVPPSLEEFIESKGSNSTLLQLTHLQKKPRSIVKTKSTLLGSTKLNELKTQKTTVLNKTRAETVKKNTTKKAGKPTNHDKPEHRPGTPFKSLIGFVGKMPNLEELSGNEDTLDLCLAKELETNYQIKMIQNQIDLFQNKQKPSENSTSISRKTKKTSKLSGSQETLNLNLSKELKTHDLSHKINSDLDVIKDKVSEIVTSRDCTTNVSEQTQSEEVPTSYEGASSKKKRKKKLSGSEESLNLNSDAIIEKVSEIKKCRDSSTNVSGQTESEKAPKIFSGSTSSRKRTPKLSGSEITLTSNPDDIIEQVASIEKSRDCAINVDESTQNEKLENRIDSLKSNQTTNDRSTSAPKKTKRPPKLSGSQESLNLKFGKELNIVDKTNNINYNSDPIIDKVSDSENSQAKIGEKLENRIESISDPTKKKRTTKLSDSQETLHINPAKDMKSAHSTGNLESNLDSKIVVENQTSEDCTTNFDELTRSENLENQTDSGKNKRGLRKKTPKLSGCQENLNFNPAKEQESVKFNSELDVIKDKVLENQTGKDCTNNVDDSTQSDNLEKHNETVVNDRMLNKKQITEKIFLNQKSFDTSTLNDLKILDSDNNPDSIDKSTDNTYALNTVSENEKSQDCSTDVDSKNRTSKIDSALRSKRKKRTSFDDSLQARNDEIKLPSKKIRLEDQPKTQIKRKKVNFIGSSDEAAAKDESSKRLLTERKKLRKTLDSYIKKTSPVTTQLISTTDTDSDGCNIDFLGFDEDSLTKLENNLQIFKVAEMEDMTPKCSKLNSPKMNSKRKATTSLEKKETISSISRKSMPPKKRWEMMHKPNEETDITDDTTPDHEDDDDNNDDNNDFDSIRTDQTLTKDGQDELTVIVNIPENSSAPNTPNVLESSINVQKRRGRPKSTQKVPLNSSIGKDLNTTSKSIKRGRKSNTSKPNSPVTAPLNNSKIVKNPMRDTTSNYIAANDTSLGLPKKRGRKPKSLMNNESTPQFNNDSTPKLNNECTTQLNNECLPQLKIESTPELSVLPTKRIRKPKLSFDDKKPLILTTKSSRLETPVLETKSKIKKTIGRPSKLENTTKNDSIQLESDNSSAELTPKIKKKQAARSKAENLPAINDNAQVDSKNSSSFLTPEINKKRVRRSKTDTIPTLNDSAPLDSSNSSILLTPTTTQVSGRPQSDVTFNPRMLLMRDREQLNSEDDLSENGRGSGPLQCGLCFGRSTKDEWLQHLSEHYGVGWIVGHPPLNVSSRSVILSTIINFMKIKTIKGLSCRLCQRVYRSALGLLQHIEMCGVVQERIECPYCNRLYSKLSLSIHERSCTERIHQQHEVEKNESVKNLEPSEEVLNVFGRTKRISTIKAETKLKEIGEQLVVEQIVYTPFNPKDHIKYEREFDASRFRSKWIEDLKSFDKVFCPQQICKFSVTDLNAIEEHMQECQFMSKNGYYYCTKCEDQAKVFATEKAAIAHVLKAHRSQTEFESDASDYDTGIDDESSEEYNSSGVDSNEEMMNSNGSAYEVMRSKNIEFHKYKSPDPFKVYKKLYPERCKQVPKLIAYKWNEFTHKNYTKSMLFSFMLPNFELIKDRKLDKFLPLEKNSMKFEFSDSTEIPTSCGAPYTSTMNWTELKRFESVDRGDEHFSFVGAPIKALAWIPLPAHVPQQYLAVSYRKNMETYTRMVNTKLKSTIILIYKVTQNEETSSKIQTQIHYGIHIPDGPVHCFAFLPSGGYDVATNRLGLIAVGTANSQINIYALPLAVADATNVDTESVDKLTILDLKPAAVLTIDLQTSICAENNILPQCVQISWSESAAHNYIFAGFSTGYIGIWDIDDNESDNLNILKVEDDIHHFLPLNYFYFGEKNVRFLAVHYDSVGPRWLALGSYSRKYSFYDIRNLSQPIQLKEDTSNNVIGCFDWSPVWETMVIGFSDIMPTYGRCVHYKNLPGVLYGEKSLDSMLAGVKAAHYSPLRNVQVYGVDNGDIVYYHLREMYFEPNLSKISTSKRAVSMTDIRSLNGESLTHNSDGTKKVPCLDRVEDYKNKYGLVFLPVIQVPNNKKNNYLSEKRRAPNYLFKYMRINCLRYNCNTLGRRLIAVGCENGFLRIINFNKEKYIQG